MAREFDIALIVAMSVSGVIGAGGALPWHVSEDLRFFKEKTMGHALIMGRRTYDSMGGALPGRHNIVLSRSGFRADARDGHDTRDGHDNCEVCDSVESALRSAGSYGEGRIFVIGGGEIFALFLPMASVIYVTELDMACRGDVYFPSFDVGEWRRHAGDWCEAINKRDGEKVRYRFIEWVRK